MDIFRPGTGICGHSADRSMGVERPYSGEKATGLVAKPPREVGNSIYWVVLVSVFDCWRTYFGITWAKEYRGKLVEDNIVDPVRTFGTKLRTGDWLLLVTHQQIGTVTTIPALRPLRRSL